MLWKLALPLTVKHEFSGDAIPGCLLALSAVTALAIWTFLFISDLPKYFGNSTYLYCCRYCSLSWLYVSEGVNSASDGGDDASRYEEAV